MKIAMNEAELQSKLYAAARVHAPSDRVPYAFEKRVMAQLSGRRTLELSAFWARALWRAAASCLAVTLLLSAWSWFAPTGAQGPDLAQDFESTLLAAADQETPADSLW